MFARADIAKQGEIEAAVKGALARWKTIDVLVNDAAMMVFSPVVELDPADWDRVMAVNLRAPFLFAKLCLPHMRRGAIVNVSSVHAYETTANVAPYAASKGGIEALARALSREIKPEQARVNCVAPGAVDTPMLRNNPNVRSGKEKIAGAVGRPEDIAHAICWVASDEARFVHGATLVVDGGRLDIL
jgi:NAD(P)-dependent dehydrogenase (short-subunit alcohol dehydrogenase family)